jgi:hypothetical protein
MAGNSANNEDPPISCAFKEGLFVDSANDEEPVRDDEPVASLAPVGQASKERADDDSVNDEELVDYELPDAPQDNEGSVASVERVVINSVVNKELVDIQQAGLGVFSWTCPSPHYLSLTNVVFFIFFAGERTFLRTRENSWGVGGGRRHCQNFVWQADAQTHRVWVFFRQSVAHLVFSSVFFRR